MKSYIKGLVTGLLIGTMVTAIPAVAENIDALFNEVRININGIDRVQWGESITLDDGTQTPYSILYNGTTYLPLRKTAELLGKEVYWNGDSRTVSVVDSGSKTIIAEKTDANGNVWKYYTLKSEDDIYIGVMDETRGYERIYKTMSHNKKTAVTVTDEAIYFAKYKGNFDNHPHDFDGAVQKILFANNPDTQDGEEVFGLKIEPNSAVFDGEYIYSVYTVMTLSPTPHLCATNIYTGETASYTTGRGTDIDEITLKGEGKIEAVVRTPGGTFAKYEIIFDKSTNTFSESKRTILEDM